MRNHEIAIQGSVSSFHDLAAKKYFGEAITINECGSFKEVCQKIENNEVDYGIIAIENKVAGSILLNYLLIEQYNLHIIGETYLPIELHLLGKKGSKLSDIKEVVSHPMALGQSQIFLADHNHIAVSEYKDTATCAKLVEEDTSGQTAVIGGAALLNSYDLEILAEKVSDVQTNFTRFYILSKGKDYVSDPNKGSVTMQINNEPGKLSEVLQVINKYGFNLSKIQSLPIPYKSNVYPFHFDFEFDNKQEFEKCLTELEGIVESLKVLGIYKSELLSEAVEKK
jgi:prephenate dehydratase